MQKSLFLGRCANWRCRNPLGVMVWKESKFSNRAFCSKDCCERYALVERQNQKVTREPPKVSVNREVQLRLILFEEGKS